MAVRERVKLFTSESVLAEYLQGVAPAKIADARRVSIGRVQEVIQNFEQNLPRLGEISVSSQHDMFGGSKVPAFNPSTLVTRKGLQVYDKMRKDEQIKAALMFKKNSVIVTGYEVVAPEGFGSDWIPKVFVEQQLETVEGLFQNMLLEVLSALDYGFSVSEIVYKSIDEGTFKGNIGLRYIKTRRPHDLQFYIDSQGNLAPNGILQLTKSGVKNYPTDKFLVFSYLKEFSNWYGVSDLEAAYRTWWIKENAYRWLAMLLERFGIPPIMAMYNPGGMTPAQVTALQNVIQRLQAATSAAIPRMDKDSLEFWAPQLGTQTQQVFIPALQMFNSDLARALLMPGQLGMTGESNFGSFAKARVNFDVFLLVVQSIRQQLEDVINESLVRPLVLFNFAGVEQLPRFKFLPLTDNLRIDVMNAWTQMVSSGIVIPQPADERHIRRAFGFPAKEQGMEETNVPEDEKDTPPEDAAPEDSEADPKAPEDGEDLPELGYPAGPPANEDGEEEDEQHEGHGHHSHAQATSRKPNPFEKFVDFAQISRDLDAAEAQAKEKLVPIMRDVRDRFLGFVQKNYPLNTTQIKQIKQLRGTPALKKAYSDLLVGVLDKGKLAMKTELAAATKAGAKNVKKFAAPQPNFVPQHAVNFLKNKATFFVTGINNALTSQSQLILSQALASGSGVRDVMKSLRDVFTPYVGDPNVIRDGKVVGPSRLETIVRTNFTEAFNRGRLVQARQTPELVSAFEFSAVLDARTTEVCQFLDGKVFRSDDPALDRLSPPRHYNCRSVLVPITIDETVDEADFITAGEVGRALHLSQDTFTEENSDVR